MVEDALLIGVDVGTSAIRASAYTGSGARVASVRRQRTRVYATTFDTAQMWTDFVACVRELAMLVGSASVMGIGFAGHVGTVLVGGDVRSLGDGSLWSDARGADALRAVWRERPEMARETGRATPTGSSLALLCWARDEKRDLLEQVCLALTPKDYLILRVTGVAGTDVTSAAYSLAFNVRKLTWATEVIEESGLRSSDFPSTMTAATVVGNVTAASASILGLASGTPVVCGGPDGTVGAAALLGGEVGPVADVAGTTDVVTALTGARDFAPPSGAVVNPFVAPNLWSYGGPTGLTGGAVVWLAGTLGYPDLRAALTELGTVMEALPPGCDGLLVVPFLTGSRFPEWDGLERATLYGLGRQHQPQHLLRAAQEGAAFAARHALEQMGFPHDGGRSAPAVLVGGGAVASSAAARLRADVLGAPVLVGEDAEVSARGAAMLAGIGCGVFEDLASAHQVMRPRMAGVAPDPDRAPLFQAAYERWRGVRECLRTIRYE